MLLPTRQSDLNGLASVAEALIAGLYDDKPNGTWNPHTVEVAGERLFGCMVVEQDALTENGAVSSHDAKGVGITLGSVVGRGNRDIEVECVGSTRSNTGSQDVGMFLLRAVSGQ